MESRSCENSDKTELEARENTNQVGNTTTPPQTDLHNTLLNTLEFSKHEHPPLDQSGQAPVEGDGHRHLPLEGPGIGHHHRQHNPSVKEIIKEIRKQMWSKKSIRNYWRKKKTLKNELKKVLWVTKIKWEENIENTENIEENKENQIPIQNKNSYLRIPEPGTKASPGCLKNPCWKEKFGEMSSSDHSSSPGAIRSFTVFHGSSVEWEISGPKCDSSRVISKRILGSDACSCSSAATHCGTVLAGKNFSNFSNGTLGGKTTGGRYLNNNIDKESSLSGQLGQQFGPTRSYQGISNSKQQQIKSPEARTSDRSAWRSLVSGPAQFTIQKLFCLSDHCRRNA